MSSLQMPKVDSSILSKKDKIVSDIGRIINPKNVLSHPDELRPFETDGLTAYRQMPLVVVTVSYTHLTLPTILLV